MAPAKRPQRRAVHPQRERRGGTKWSTRCAGKFASRGSRPQDGGEIFPRKGLNGTTRDLRDERHAGMDLEETDAEEAGGCITLQLCHSG